VIPTRYPQTMRHYPAHDGTAARMISLAFTSQHVGRRGWRGSRSRVVQEAIELLNTVGYLRGASRRAACSVLEVLLARERFDHYYDPAQMGVGALRVFNDDRLQPGAAWPPHPHRDIESGTRGPLMPDSRHRKVADRSHGDVVTVRRSQIPGPVRAMAVAMGGVLIQDHAQVPRPGGQHPVSDPQPGLCAPSARHKRSPRASRTISSRPGQGSRGRHHRRPSSASASLPSALAAGFP
jgi:hypothetical protein